MEGGVDSVEYTHGHDLTMNRDHNMYQSQKKVQNCAIMNLSTLAIVIMISCRKIPNEETFLCSTLRTQSHYLYHGEHPSAILGDDHLVGEGLEPVPEVGLLQLN